MKIHHGLVIGMLMCAIPAAGVKAQCNNGSTPNVITYDSTVVGVGNAPYNFTFPKFDPVLGTLTEVRIQSVVSVRYAFDLENGDAAVRNIRHSLLRYDDVYSSALIDPIFNSTTSDFGPYRLQPTDNVTGSGTDYIAVGPLDVLSNDTLVNEAVSNVADFMGPGNVEFQYVTSPGTSFSGSNPSYNGTITDVVKFNVSYVYCTTLFLNSNHITLAASAAGATSALLNWKTTNEKQAKSYEVMVSKDGIHFTTAVVISAKPNSISDNGSYQYLYEFSSPVDKLYFRVKQISKDNKTGISPTRPVNWSLRSNDNAFTLSPGGEAIDTHLPISGGSAWQVDLFGINGQLIQQNRISATLGGAIPLHQRLQKGIYVLRATNLSTRSVISQKLFVR
jgi:hypothetical protein